MRELSNKTGKNDILIGIDLNAFEFPNKQNHKSYFLDYSKYIRMISDYLPLNFREYNSKSKGDVGSYLDISSRTFQIMQDKIIQSSIENHNPDIVFADEPTGNLDPVASFELVRLLESIYETGTTILMASHNYNLIKGRGRPILEMKDGVLRGK